MIHRAKGVNELSMSSAEGISVVEDLPSKNY